jgi:hypothetical protein
MIYSDDPSAVRPPSSRTYRRRSREQRFCARRRRGAGTGADRPAHRGALRAADGHRVGASDGSSGELFVVQARPETVQSQQAIGSVERYLLKERGAVLVRRAQHRAQDRQRPAWFIVIDSVSAMERVREGDVLVTDMTDPDWEPIMKRAAADRDQPRWPYLPCRDHRARARHSRGGRLRQCHATAARWHGGHRVMRRRRCGLCLRRHARFRDQHR